MTLLKRQTAVCLPFPLLGLAFCSLSDLNHLTKGFTKVHNLCKGSTDKLPVAGMGTEYMRPKQDLIFDSLHLFSRFSRLYFFFQCSRSKLILLFCPSRTMCKMLWLCDVTLQQEWYAKRNPLARALFFISLGYLRVFLSVNCKDVLRGLWYRQPICGE